MWFYRSVSAAGFEIRAGETPGFGQHVTTTESRLTAPVTAPSALSKLMTHQGDSHQVLINFSPLISSSAVLGSAVSIAGGNVAVAAVADDADDAADWAARLVTGTQQPSVCDPGYMTRKLESLDRINSISEINGSLDSSNSFKRLAV